MVLLHFSWSLVASERLFASLADVTMTATTAEQLVDLDLVELVSGLWCGSLDPSVLSGADAARGAERLAVVIRRFEAAQLRFHTKV